MIWSQKPFAEFEMDTRPLFDRLEKARRRVLTPPEWCFRLARAKHKAGHYNHDYDDRAAEMILLAGTTRQRADVQEATRQLLVALGHENWWKPDGRSANEP